MLHPLPRLTGPYLHLLDMYDQVRVQRMIRQGKTLPGPEPAPRPAPPPEARVYTMNVPHMFTWGMSSSTTTSGF